MSTPIQVFPPKEAPKAIPASLTLVVASTIFFVLGVSVAVQF